MTMMAEAFWIMTSTGAVWVYAYRSLINGQHYYRAYFRNELTIAHGIMDDFGNLVETRHYGT